MHARKRIKDKARHPFLFPTHIISSLDFQQSNPSRIHNFRSPITEILTISSTGWRSRRDLEIVTFVHLIDFPMVCWYPSKPSLRLKSTLSSCHQVGKSPKSHLESLKVDISVNYAIYNVGFMLSPFELDFDLWVSVGFEEGFHKMVWLGFDYRHFNHYMPQLATLKLRDWWQ